jgi:ribosome maturation factor RimP
MKNKELDFSKAETFVGKTIKGTKISSTEEFEGKVLQVNEAGIIIEYPHRKQIIYKMIPFSSIVDFFIAYSKNETEAPQ